MVGLELTVTIEERIAFWNEKKTGKYEKMIADQGSPSWKLKCIHDAISPPKPVREDWSRSRDLAPGHVTIVQMSRDLPSRSRDHPGVTWANSTRDPKGKLDKRLQRHLNPLVGIPLCV